MAETEIRGQVLGFLFNNDLSKVLLVNRKNAKQGWQNGKDNGLGGKGEVGETPLAAMVREFEEESEGIRIENWIQFGSMGGTGWNVDLFYAISNLVPDNFLRETREGTVRWCLTEDLPKTIIKPEILVPTAKYIASQKEMKMVRFDFE